MAPLKKRMEAVAARLAQVGISSPRDVERRLIEAGYRGQERARRAAAVLAYRHLQRARRVYEGKVRPDRLPPRENVLFLGPTGCGKTYLAELLFRHILKVPTVTVDITQFSETGYVGEDVSSLMTRLYQAAEEDLAWTACGVICIDEFDKVAGARTSARFGGTGSTKDVSGYGVQRGLLTLLSGATARFSTDGELTAMSERVELPMDCVSFICCGAFSGLNAMKDMAGGRQLGFHHDPKVRKDGQIAAGFEESLLEDVTSFAHYGMLPELIGRFTRLVAFDPLGRAELSSILEDNLLQAYVREFRMEGLKLEVDLDVRDHIIDGAIRRQTGARGLRSALAPYLERAAFEHFGADTEGTTVRLIMDQGRISSIADVSGGDTPPSPDGLQAHA
jgi:ATP-dependent Clp protease ATP-binding subunit ClpX